MSPDSPLVLVSNRGPATFERGENGELHPVRGQLAILLPQPEIRYAYSGEAGYMFPRADGILLGGTFEHDQWEATPQPEAIARIIERHRVLMTGLRCTT